MFVYLFQSRTCARALTTDVTARNLPSRTAASPWMFVKVLQINKYRPPRCIADFDDALRQLDQFGYYIWIHKQLAPPRAVAASGRAASSPAGAASRTRRILLTGRICCGWEGCGTA